jgi:hypothetical protein
VAIEIFDSTLHNDHHNDQKAYIAEQQIGKNIPQVEDVIDAGRFRKSNFPRNNFSLNS